MKTQTKYVVMALSLAIMWLFSGCASVMDASASFADWKMRERDYRDQGFTHEGAERNATYDQIWDDK